MEEDWQIVIDMEVIHRGPEDQMNLMFEYMTNDIKTLRANYPNFSKTDFDKWKSPTKGEICLVQIHGKRLL